MRLHKFIIKTDKRLGTTELHVTDENGGLFASLIKARGSNSMRIVSRSHTIKGYKQNYANKEKVRLFLNEVAIGYFIHTDDYRSDLEVSIDGERVIISSFSDHLYASARVLLNGVEVGLMSKKQFFLKTEYGFAVYADTHEFFLLLAIVLHIDYVSMGLLEKLTINI